MLKSLLKQRTCLGVIQSLNCAEVTELLSHTGVSWIMVDMEHTTIGPHDVKSFCQAAAGRCAIVPRVPWNEVTVIKSILDGGCDGVIVPQICTAEEARQVVRYTKYRPVGERGVGMGRAHQYGLQFNEYIARANDSVATIIQIEHIDAVKRIEEIAAVSGIDGIFIGPYDLSDSMGLRGQLDHPDVAAAIQTVKRTCEKHKLATAIYAGNPQAVEKRVAEGYQLIILGTDAALLATGMQNALTSLKQEAA